MKKLTLALLIFLLVGCEKPAKPPVVVINDYSITADEFERQFNASPFAKSNTIESRKQFMEMLINRKLMLQEAQKLGLDRDQAFLEMIERFWEQSLLKAYLDEQSKEVANKVMISDFAVEQAYKNLAAEGKADKPYEEMYRTLKWELARAKETELMDKKLQDLRKNAHIKMNLKLLEAK